MAEQKEETKREQEIESGSEDQPQINPGDTEIKDIGEALQDVPFEELLKMKSQGFTKKKKISKDPSIKKGKKNEPVERSSKIPVKSFEPVSEKHRVIRISQ